MLKGISPLLSPDLLKLLAEMGHGDELVLADAHFPAYSLHSRVLRADGLKIGDLLAAIMPLIELDQYVEQALVMMHAVAGDLCDPAVEQGYLRRIGAVTNTLPEVEKMDRYAFYERSKKVFAIVLTGETAKYGNIILKKGVIGG